MIRSLFRVELHPSSQSKSYLAFNPTRISSDIHNNAISYDADGAAMLIGESGTVRLHADLHRMSLHLKAQRRSR